MGSFAASAGIAAFTAALTLLVRYVVTRVTHSGSVRTSDAETVFKASEAVRNDLATELVATRQERDQLLTKLTDCLEGRRHE